MNNFSFSDTNKRYHTLNYYNKCIYGKRIFKAVIDAGFTCPNVDGTKGVGGCIYCSGGSGYFTENPALSVKKQLDDELIRIRKKYPDGEAIAYFQAHTNTYGDIERLQECYYAAISHENIVGISIATRADCLEDEKLELLSELAGKARVTVELGLQSSNDKTGVVINRCCKTEEYEKAILKLKKSGIRTCVHIINGLPGEVREDMLNTARWISENNADAVKIHLLHINEGTRLAELYKKGLYMPMEKEDYVLTVAQQLELIPAETVIERVTGDGAKETLIAPLWSRNKISVINDIDKLMAKNDSYQGKKVRRM